MTPGTSARYIRISILCVVAGASCRSSALERCERAFTSGAHQVAIERCTKFYAKSGATGAAVIAARAHFERGQDQEVMFWARRLGDEPEAAIVWRHVAWIHARHGRQDASRDAHRRALRAFKAAGKLDQAAHEANALMSSYWRSSELLQALEYAQECYVLAHEATSPSMRMYSIHGLFSMLFEIGDYRAARALLDRARHDLSRDDPEALMFLGVNEALLHKHDGHLRLARAAYERTLTLASSIDRARHAGLVRAVRLNLVEILIELGELRAAEEQLQAANREEPEELDRNMRTSRLYFQAQVERARGQHETAESSLRQALDAQPIDDWVWHLEHALGQALEAQSRAGDAEAAYQRAIAVIERLRGTMTFDDYKNSLLDERREPYEALFALRARAGRVHDALEVAEKARARAFLDAFARGARDAEADGQRLGDAARSRLAAFVDMAPHLSASPVVAPKPIAAVLRATERDHVLFYFQAGDAVWLYSRAHGKERLQRLGAPVATIASQVERFLVDVDDSGAAARLGALLLPSGALPATGDTVMYVIADGAVGRIPFAALRRHDRYLAADYQFAYVPSMSALAELREHDQEAQDPAVVIGAPATTDERPALAGALAEARIVAARLGVDAHTGHQATTAALRRAAHASLLHIATHGGLSAHGAWMELHGGRIHANQILAWSLRPRVVVLASCASGARHGYGMWGALGAAFLASGSHAVVSTLWSVRDQPTRDFVEAFYARGGAREPVRALAEAQRQSIAAGRPPSQWAPFVVFGAAP